MRVVVSRIFNGSKVDDLCEKASVKKHLLAVGIDEEQLRPKLLKERSAFYLWQQNLNNTQCLNMILL